MSFATAYRDNGPINIPQTSRTHQKPIVPLGHCKQGTQCTMNCDGLWDMGYGLQLLLVWTTVIAGILGWAMGEGLWTTGLYCWYIGMGYGI